MKRPTEIWQTEKMVPVSMNKLIPGFHFRYQWLFLFTLSLSALGWSGCRKSDQPPLAAVTGQVKLDGSPLAGAFVKFSPDFGRSSRAVCDDNGNFELIYIRREEGAVIGNHKVIITTEFEIEEDLADSGLSFDRQSRKPSREKVPRKFNVESKLTRKVEPGNNVFNFDLSSQ